MNAYTNTLVTLCLCAGHALAAPITYQGTLNDNGDPANGLYDMEFVLADSPVLGIGFQFITIDDVEVTDGLFEVELDFNDVHFDGSDRYLAVSVEGTALTPRTKVNYAPYAIRASIATTALDLEVPWVVTSAFNIVDATSTRGTPLRGYAMNTFLDDPGVLGETDSTAELAAGVLGRANARSDTGGAAGVRGITQGTGFTGYGVHGQHLGNGVGVFGESNGVGSGVFGTSAAGLGVIGTTPEGTGVFGSSTNGIGVRASSSTDLGMLTTTSSGLAAIEGSNGSSDTEFRGASQSYGLEAYHNQSDGEGTAIFGSGGRTGIYGESTNSGFGPSLTRTGVQGFAGSFSTGANTFYGVHGFAQNPASGGSRTAYGVYGGAQVGTTASTAYGVYGEVFGPGGAMYAGYFAGDVHVLGTLSKSSGSFKIDHPLDPENKYLSHSFVESPDMMNIYNGVITLDSEGSAVVELPDYFEALNRDFRYQLTAMGAPMPNLYIASEISANQFMISGGVPNARVSWEVTGVRQDPSADLHRIVVEEDKPEHHQGKFLDPEAFGYGDDRSIHPRPKQN